MNYPCVNARISSNHIILLMVFKNDMKLKIKKWNATEHLFKKPGSIVLLIGKRGTGKSVLMQDLAKTMSDNGNIDMAIGFSPTDESNGALSMFIPKSLIHSEFDENVIERIVNSQKKLLKQGKPLKRIFLFMDDVGYDSKKIFSSKIIKNLFFNGRHYSIGLMLIMQYCIDVPTWARSNIDVTISLKEQILVNREKLFKNFFGAFTSQSSFNQAMDVLTENYKALVCANNLSQSNELTDTIFWYKARHGLEPFLLGSTVVKKMDQLCYEDRELILEEQRQREKARQDQANIERVVPTDEDGMTVYSKRRVRQ